MQYYCNECKKTISPEEFSFSMNRFKRALCREHQSSSKMSKTTKDLQELMRKRHKDELVQEVPQLKTIKDWIRADLQTWDKALKQEGADSFMVKFSEEDAVKSRLKQVKKKEIRK